MTQIHTDKIQVQVSQLYTANITCFYTQLLREHLISPAYWKTIKIINQLSQMTLSEQGLN